MYHVQISEVNFFFTLIHDRNCPEILGFIILSRHGNFGVFVVVNTCLVSKFLDSQKKGGGVGKCSIVITKTY